MTTLVWTPFQTTLPMFRNKTFTVRRRFSDFLGLYEKLSEKHGPNGYIVPPPPEKSILGRLTGFYCCLWYCNCKSPSAIRRDVVLHRYDEGEGGKGRFLVCRLCWEEKRRFGEVRRVLSVRRKLILSFKSNKSLLNSKAVMMLSCS